MKNQTVTLPLNVIYRLSAETEMMHASLQLCADSLRLHNVLGLEAVGYTVQGLADKAYETLEMLNELQNQPMAEEVTA